MTTYTYTNTRITPGTRATHHGIDVVAVNHDFVSCNECPFHPNGSNECKGTPCEGVTWLTVPDYITHRLKS